MLTLFWAQLTWFSAYILYHAALRRTIVIIFFLLALIFGGIGIVWSQYTRATRAPNPVQPQQRDTLASQQKAALRQILAIPVPTLLQTLAQQTNTYGLSPVTTQYRYHRIHHNLQAIDIEMAYHADSVASQRFILDTLALFPSLLLAEAHMHRDAVHTAEIHTTVHFCLLTQ